MNWSGVTPLRATGTLVLGILQVNERIQLNLG